MDWELKFMRWANEWWSSPFLDHTIPWLTYLGSHFAVILFILLCFIITKQRRIFRRLLLLYGIQSAIVYGLKFLVKRERPLFILEMASKLSSGPGEILDTSFPSAHAALSFMMATVLSHWFPKYRLLFYLFAVFIGWTRIYLGLHYPTDVIAGAVLSFGITKLFLHYIKVSP
jgi:undecaprenyl-diphosphatase